MGFIDEPKTQEQVIVPFRVSGWVLGQSGVPAAEIVLESATQVADDLCAKIEAAPFEIDGELIPMTASFGVACISRKDNCLTDVVVRADRALYKSKRAGRNRVDLESSQLMRALDGSLKPVSAS